jgi:hypothetical protein
MNDDEIRRLFEPLWADLQGKDDFPKRRPLLAHYTSIEALEAILRNNEVWFSNPLFMNDIEEVRFGMNAGANYFFASEKIASACRSKERFDTLKNTFYYWFNTFQKEHLLDTYVFCLSEHETGDNDGLLSMWRGYGSNGKGVAIVLDTAQLVARDESPLIIAKVQYGTAEERINWIQKLITQFADILGKSAIPDDKLVFCSFFFFQRLKLFAVFTKHQGFKEENECRVVYMRDIDKAKVFDRMFDYWIGSRGVEPKLKLKIEAIVGLPEIDLNLSKLIERIILGPSLSSPLAVGAIAKMLDALGKTELKERIKASTIPFRPA